MIRFGLSSGLASLVDLGVFFVVQTVLGLLDAFYAEILSASCGMVVNFFMQKRFVFDLQRKAYVAFFLSIAFSIAIMYLGALTLDQVRLHPYFADPDKIIIAKIPVMGFKFVLNYFSKRWVFERKILKS